MAKKKEEENPKVHEDLEGFKISINEFGEITSNLEIDKLNEFLNENVEDKKLVGKDPGEPFEEEEEEDSGDEKLFEDDEDSDE